MYEIKFGKLIGWKSQRIGPVRRATLTFEGIDPIVVNMGKKDIIQRGLVYPFLERQDFWNVVAPPDADLSSSHLAIFDARWERSDERHYFSSEYLGAEIEVENTRFELEKDITYLLITQNSKSAEGQVIVRADTVGVIEDAVVERNKAMMNDFESITPWYRRIQAQHFKRQKAKRNGKEQGQKQPATPKKSRSQRFRRFVIEDGEPR